MREKCNTSVKIGPERKWASFLKALSWNNDCGIEWGQPKWLCFHKYEFLPLRFVSGWLVWSLPSLWRHSICLYWWLNSSSRQTSEALECRKSCSICGISPTGASLIAEPKGISRRLILSEWPIGWFFLSPIGRFLYFGSLEFVVSCVVSPVPVGYFRSNQPFCGVFAVQ